MIDLYFWPTGNGKKSVILLEELGMPYTIKPINIGRGDQLTPEFLRISPKKPDVSIRKTCAADTMSPSGSAGNWPIKVRSLASKAISVAPRRPEAMAISPTHCAALTTRPTGSTGS